MSYIQNSVAKSLLSSNNSVSYKGSLILLFFCISVLSLSAQLSSSLNNSILRIEEDATNFSTLDKGRLYFSALAAKNFIDLDASEGFLKLHSNHILNATKTAELRPDKLIIEENVFFDPISTPANYAYSSELKKSDFSFHYDNINTDVRDSWVFSTDNKNKFFHLNKIVGDASFVALTKAITFKDNTDDNIGSLIQIGILGDPEYTLDITHRVAAGEAWGDGNGLMIRNDGNSKRDWLHYVVNSTGNYAFYADGNIKANIDHTSGNWVPASDRRLKKNIHSLDAHILQKIMRLNPTTYQFKNQESSRKVYGLIAQEVQKVFPDIVMPLDESGETMGVSYTELIPILTTGIQEQQTYITEQAEQIQSLEIAMQQLQMEMEQIKKAILGGAGNGNNKILPVTLSSAKLFQNAPNPFNGSTRINYFLPENTQKAVLKISNINGQVIKVIPITQTGEGSVQIETNQLVAGTYQYTLWVDGQLVEARQMVLAIK